MKAKQIADSLENKACLSLYYPISDLDKHKLDLSKVLLSYVNPAPAYYLKFVPSDKPLFFVVIYDGHIVKNSYYHNKAVAYQFVLNMINSAMIHNLNFDVVGYGLAENS